MSHEKKTKKGSRSPSKSIREREAWRAYNEFVNSFPLDKRERVKALLHSWTALGAPDRWRGVRSLSAPHVLTGCVSESCRLVSTMRPER
jgi:hypothetical protein